MTTLHEQRAELIESIEILERKIRRQEKNVAFMDRDLQALKQQIGSVERQTGTEAALLRQKRANRVRNHVEAQEKLLTLRDQLRQARNDVARIDGEIEQSRRNLAAGAVAQQVDSELRTRASALLKALGSVRAHGYHYPDHVQAAEERLREVVA